MTTRDSPPAAVPLKEGPFTSSSSHVVALASRGCTSGRFLRRSGPQRRLARSEERARVSSQGGSSKQGVVCRQQPVGPRCVPSRTSLRELPSRVEEAAGEGRRGAWAKPGAGGGRGSRVRGGGPRSLTERHTHTQRVRREASEKAEEDGSSGRGPGGASCFLSLSCPHAAFFPRRGLVHLI